MGWTVATKAPTVSVRQFLEGEMGEGYQIVDYEQVGRVVYLALRDPQGHVGAVVILVEGWDNSTTIQFKAMDEEHGPHYYGCPVRILDQLSPTDSEWADKWRRQCREQQMGNR